MEDAFSVRIVSVDSFASKPVKGLDVTYSDFKCSRVKKVPVLRVFGSTPAGQSVCMYVHGAFPYLMLPYYGPADDFQHSNTRQYLHQFAVSLDQALNTASGFVKSTQEHVYKIVLLRGRPFYGFHENDEIFMKVYFYTPSDVKRSSDLLQAGAIMNQSYQPHEAHVPFILQFFLDYNLYGMNLLHSKCSWFRKPLGKPKNLPDLPMKSGACVKSDSSQAQQSDETSKDTSVTGNLRLSQLHNFNWNKLRTRNLQDSEISLNQQSTTTMETESQAMLSQCQHVCQSFVSRTFNASHRGHCPFHTIWSQSTVPADAFLTSTDTERLSTCDLEVDILATDILNRNEIKDSLGKNPGIASIWEDEKARRRGRGENSQIEIPKSQIPRPEDNVFGKETVYLKELRQAIEIYCQEKEISPTQPFQSGSSTHTPRKPSTEFYDSISNSPFEGDTQKLVSDNDKTILDSEDFFTRPIVENEIVSQIVASQSKSNKSSQDVNSSLLDLLQDMDTVMGSLPSQHTDTIQEHSGMSNEDSDTEMWEHDDAERIKSVQKSLCDRDANESYVMTQAWEHGIEDLISKDEFPACSEDEMDIPQLDGTTDEILNANDDVKCGRKRLGTTRRFTSMMSNADETRSAVSTSTTSKTDATECNAPNHTTDTDTPSKSDQKVNGQELGLNKITQSNIAKAICKKLRRQNSAPTESSSTLNAMSTTKIDENSNMFSTFQNLMDDATLVKQQNQLDTSKLFALTDQAPKQLNIPEKVDTRSRNAVIDLSKTKVTPMKHHNQQECQVDLSGKTVNPCKQITNVAGASVTISSDPSAVVASWDKPSPVEQAENTRKKGALSSMLRPRRSRQISSYVNQSFFETEFENEWEDFVDPSAQLRTKKHKPNYTRSSSKKTNKARSRTNKQKEKVIIKWIITNRFKGVHNMNVKLWKIPLQKQVVLSEKLMEMYELYSPKKPIGCNGPMFGQKPSTFYVQPPKIPSPPVRKIPKGKRTKENVVSQFHPLEDTVLSNADLKTDSPKPVVVEHEPENVVQKSGTFDRNFFENAIVISEEMPIIPVVPLKPVEPVKPSEQFAKVELSVVDSAVQHQEQSVKKIEPVTIDNSHVAKDLPKRPVPVAKKPNSRTGKLKWLLAKNKQASKKYSSMLLAGKNAHKNKITSDMIRRAMKKSNNHKMRKLKARRNIKKSQVLPVTNRTVTPVNQLTPLSEPDTENLDLKEPKSEDPASIQTENGNIFTRISPFVASETVAMLKTIPEITAANAKEVGKIEDNVQSHEVTFPSAKSESVSEEVGKENLPFPVMVNPLAQKKPHPVVPKKYLPTRRVTRHSVAVRMKSLPTPEWMYTKGNDVSIDEDLHNVLDMFGRQSPIPDKQNTCDISPPRPWSPMLSPNNTIPVPDQTQPLSMQNITPELSIDAEAVLNDIEGMDDIIRGVKLSTSQEEDSNLLSHLDALLMSESFASECAVESDFLDGCLQQSDDLKATSKAAVSFMDILLDTQNEQPSAESVPSETNSNATNQSSIIENPLISKTSVHENLLGVNLYPTTMACSPSNTGTDTVTKKMDFSVVSTEGNTGNFELPFASHPNAGSSLGLNTRAIQNKQSLQEQLHKQMQAVYLQQQMLDNNNFRTESLIMPKKKIVHPSKDACQKSSEISMNVNPPKDVLDEVCQHVFSDSSLSTNVSEHLTTFDILGTQSSAVEINKTRSVTPKNTFLYPCQPLDSVTSLCGKAYDLALSQNSAPVLHVPVPPANPLQVVHTHVHHHHHIHSIKDATSATKPKARPTTEMHFDEKLAKTEHTPLSQWPVKSQPSDFTASQETSSNDVKTFNTDNKPLKVAPQSLDSSSKHPFSILMKPTCQNGDEKYWLQVQMQHGIPWYRKDKTIKGKKSSTIEKLASETSRSNKAKTPYVASKLNDIENGLKFSEDQFSFPTTGRLNKLKRKAPSNTPTICLNQTAKRPGGLDAAVDKFEMSQDMFGNSTDQVKKINMVSKTPEVPSEFVKPPQPKKKTLPKKKKSDGSKPTKKQPNSPSISKANKSIDGSRYCSRFTTVPLVTSQLCKMSQGQSDTKTILPAITDKEELILNYETGQWEVVAKNQLEVIHEIPVVLKPEEQTLGNFVSLAEMDEQDLNKKSDDSNPGSENPLKFCVNLENKDRKRSLDPSLHAVLEHEYVVENADSQTNSLKLKLTLKKKGGNLASGDISSVSVRGKGKPSSFEAIVKQDFSKSLKKSSKIAKKRKLSKVYILDTSVCDKFIEVPNQPRGANLLLPVICNPTKPEPFQTTAYHADDHLRLVKNFCAVRAANVSLPPISSQHPLTENNALNALAALDLDMAVVTVPISGNNKPASECNTAPQQSTSASCFKDVINSTTKTTVLAESMLKESGKYGLKVSTGDSTDTVFIATPAPPSKDVIAKSMMSLPCEDSVDPFYGDASDVQPTSTRLFATLPSYVKIPKLKSSMKEMPEFETHQTSGILHWRMVFAEKAFATNPDKFVSVVTKAQAIFQQNKITDVILRDPMDVISNIPKYPFLVQAISVDNCTTTVVKPACHPPTYGEVQEWLDARSTKTSKKKQEHKIQAKSPEQVLSKEKIVPPVYHGNVTPKFQASFSGYSAVLKPRKVSFDLCETKISEADSMLIEEYPSFDQNSSETIPPNQMVKQPSPSQNSDDSLLLRVSTGSESMLSFSSPENDETKSKGSSTSAIATLVGASNEEPEDIPLTPLLSGQFTTQHLSASPCSTVPKALSGQLQSTPLSGVPRRLKKQALEYTPIAHNTPSASNNMHITSKVDTDRPSPNLKHGTMPSLHTPNIGTSPYSSDIVGPTLNNSYGFRAAQLDLGEAKALHEQQHLTVVSMELHVHTRLDLKPDPELDSIRAIFYAIQVDNAAQLESGAFVVGSNKSTSESCHILTRAGVTNLPVTYVGDEMELFSAFASMIVSLDPDILIGYEVQMLSWGYLLDRAGHLGVDLCRGLSRVPGDETHNRHTAEADVYGADNASEIHIVGRIVLNLWRLMRTEVALCDYSFESITFHLLHERHPAFSHKTLTVWFDAPQYFGKAPPKMSNSRHRAIDYYMCRVLGNLKLISQQDLIGRTSELARVFGIQFYEVLTRGSQFRVESMMLRLAHGLNYVAVSPTNTQRAGMKAPECIPLVMEPQSRFYSEPVIVVDFQSLYPSVVIAHNYCFSTCLGRVQHLGKSGKFIFGCSSLNVPPRLLRNLLKNDAITIAPNGVAYVKKSVRNGVLPIMLDEILNTRIMVKNSMKQCDDSATKRLLDHRQLGLKYIANFTYGYTSASFSGRMPCVEIADSIVHKARETLERAIELVHRNHDRWEGRVVYGDTDSMFIALKPGTSKQRAFEVGREIINEVTYDNPQPMKLKLEKVYQPCILQTKKRYVGYAYESENQVEPIFDAKGIETVRRDGCPAVAKILEKSLRLLFESRDVSQVKSFVQKQWTKILDGRSALQDCTIAKEYRGAKYYRPGAIVPALVLARKRLAEDKRSEPRLGERVAYVIVHGVPGTPLFRLVRQPHELLNDATLRLHGTYYVTKMVLPALDRVMSLLGVDVSQWYRDLPRVHRLTSSTNAENPTLAQPGANVTSKKVTISQYFESRHCVSCKGLSLQAICRNCLSSDVKRQSTAVKLANESRRLERKYHRICLICQNCSDSPSSGDTKCQSLSCPIIYKLARAKNELQRANLLRDALATHDLF
uniref:DNA polymerase zeta catalytic subunit n=1 Tax=Phallusia mammillata TaxID=59560 RepID=A0A6F9DQY9_9ASCI|nr:DNA polymerase zeta catalytic subunit-like [Phallusia mammillata]